MIFFYTTECHCYLVNLDCIVLLYAPFHHLMMKPLRIQVTLNLWHLSTHTLARNCFSVTKKETKKCWRLIKNKSYRTKMQSSSGVPSSKRIRIWLEPSIYLIIDELIYILKYWIAPSIIIRTRIESKQQTWSKLLEKQMLLLTSRPFQFSCGSA